MRAEAAAAEKEAGRSLGSRFGEEVGRFALEAPSRFLTSAAVAPVDLAVTAAGGQPLDVKDPIFGRPTYQAEGAREIGKLYDKAYAGEQFTPDDYLTAVKPFAEVPLAAAETVGLGKLAKSGVSGAKRLFGDRRTAREIQNAIELTSPALDKKAKIDAFARAGKPGGVARGRFGSVKSTPSEGDVEVAKAAMPYIKGKNPVKNAERLNAAIEDISTNSVRPYLKANPRAYNSQTLQKALNDIEPPDWIKADATAERTYTLVRNRMVQAAQEHPGTMEGLWDARISFDKIVKEQFGDAMLDPSKRSFVGRAVRDMRQGVNNFIGSQTGDSQFKESMKHLSRLFTARDNIAEKSFSLLDSNAVKKSLVKRVGGFTGKYVLPTAIGTGVATGIGYGFGKASGNQ